MWFEGACEKCDELVDKTYAWFTFTSWFDRSERKQAFGELLEEVNLALMAKAAA
jgi:hypothetical protein